MSVCCRIYFVLLTCSGPSGFGQSCGRLRRWNGTEPVGVNEERFQRSGSVPETDGNFPAAQGAQALCPCRASYA